MKQLSRQGGQIFRSHNWSWVYKWGRGREVIKLLGDWESFSKQFAAQNPNLVTELAHQVRVLSPN